MAEIKVVRSSALQCTKERAGIGKHRPEKWLIVSGDGAKSDNGTGLTICRDCTGHRGNVAITTAKARETNASKVSLSLVEVHVPETHPALRHWGWVAVAIAVAGILLTWWPVSAVAALAAGFYFAFRSPMPCLGLPEPCPVEARGVLRRCPERPHRQHNWVTLRKAIAERSWPRDLWPDWEGRRAVAGAGLAALLAWGSLLGYLATTRGWWVAVLADAGLAVIVIGGIWAWRKVRRPPTGPAM